ncbi:hypothetical protein [Argonema antarcticum]|uniref:hypothetical protein n=1 Tax=Argonema antarcticum TaxID=2942763 RepID=UPI0020119CC6|nr:hypothetical protein [Argonema antarcticum]MCL1471502.1 hypothetical protein [Argonema antarcticum A004/B2]
MNKKIVSLALGLGLVVMLGACKGGDKEAAPTSPAPASPAAPKATTAPAPAPAKTPAATPTKSP